MFSLKVEARQLTLKNKVSMNRIIPVKLYYEKFLFPGNSTGKTIAQATIWGMPNRNIKIDIKHRNSCSRVLWIVSCVRHDSRNAMREERIWFVKLSEESWKVRASSSRIYSDAFNLISDLNHQDIFNCLSLINVNIVI